MTLRHLPRIMMLRRSFASVWLALALLVAAGTAQGREGDEQKSPDLKYSVRLLRPENAESLSILDCAITIWKGDVCLAAFPTFGWLRDVSWSPDGRHVAVNNRRANSGDYLWVFRLSDGRAVRKPVDADPSASEDVYSKYIAQIQKWIATKYPEAASAKVRRLLHEAEGWSGPSVLRVKTTVTFTSDVTAIETAETYAVKANRLVLMNRKVERLPP